MTKCLLWPLPLSDGRCSFLILDSRRFRLDPRVCTICTSAYELRWGPKLGNINEYFPRIWYKGNEAHEKSHKTVDGQFISTTKFVDFCTNGLYDFPLLFSSRRIDYWKSVDDTFHTFGWLIERFWLNLLWPAFFFVSLNKIKSLVGSCMSEIRCNEKEKCSKTGSPFSLFLYTVIFPGEYIFTIQQVASSLQTRKQEWHQFTIITSTAYYS